MKLPVLHEPPSFSKSDLMASGCISWALPGSRWVGDEGKDTSARDYGTSFHELVYEAKPGEPQSEEVQSVLNFILEKKKEYPMVLQEIAFRWNPEKGEAVPEPAIKSRGYDGRFSIENGWLWGTLDFVAIDLANKKAFVADIKTGYGLGGYEQVNSGIIAACLAWQIPMANATGAIWKPMHPAYEWVPGSSELAKHENAIVRFMQGLADKQARYVPGAHCTASYCPHLEYCSEIRKVVNSLEDINWPDVPADQEEAGELAWKMKAAKKFLAHKELLLKEYCRQGGKAIAGDWEWREGDAGFRWGKRK